MSSNINQKTYAMVRILPMSKKELNGWDIKDFLLIELAIERKGKYHYRTAGMKSEPNSVILFQFDNKVIGLADLDEVKKRNDSGYFDISIDLDNDLDYKGAYYFEPHSIRTFNPVSAEEIKRIWDNEFTDNNGNKHPAFEQFNEVKHFLDPEKYPDFCRLLKSKGIEEPKILK